MVQYTVFPGRGGTPLQPQEFYVQTYVGIFPPFVQTDWPLPAPAKPIDQFLAFNFVASPWQAIDTTKVFRAHLRSLPDRGPEYHVQFRNWFGGQTIELLSSPQQNQPLSLENLAVPDAPIYPIGLRTWFGAMPPAQQTVIPNQIDWSIPRAYEYHVELRRWIVGQNLALFTIPQQLPIGEAITDRLAQPPPLALPTPQQNLSNTVLAPAVGPPPDTTHVLRAPLYTNPRGYEYHVQLRQWLGAVPPPPPTRPFAQADWPLPTAPYRIEQTVTASYNLNLIGRDQLPTGETVTDLPPQPIGRWRSLRTWVQTLALILPTPQKPFFEQYDWPNPRDYDRSIQLRTWTWQYNPSLIGQDQLPVRQQDWPYPPPVVWYREWQQNLALQFGPPTVPTLTVLRSPLYTVFREHEYRNHLRSWIQAVNLALSVAPVAQPNNQYDWPVPRAPQQAAPGFTAFYNPNLVGKDLLPFRQQDWPLTPAAQRGLDWIQSVNLALTTVVTKPFSQTDWPISFRAASLNPSFAAFYNPNLVGQDQLPFRQQDWPLPQRAVERAREWIDQTRIALTPTIIPFNQIDWPLPRAPQQPALGWAASYNLNLIGKDQLPFRQSDWPNPQRVVNRAGEWIEQTKLALFQLQPIPFRQTDWPLSAAYNPTLLQTWYTGFNALVLPTPILPPGIRFRGTIYDRPQLRRDVPPDEFFAWSRYPIIPPFVPTFGASYRLLADHYLYGAYYKPNTIITEGREIPFGWIPTLAVDPLNTLAVAAFYAAGPRNAAYEDLSTYANMYKREFADVPVNSPVTFWQQVPGTSTFQLMGLGIGNPPVGS